MLRGVEGVVAEARELLRSGRSARAFEACREGLAGEGEDRWLRYYAALALARGGNPSLAASYLQPLLDDLALETDCRTDVLSLAGRLAKDAFQRAGSPADRLQAASESARRYETAYELSGDVFPGINAATMTLLQGEQSRARELASSVLAAASRQAGAEPDYWLAATLGEASLILGDLDAASSWYRRAAALAVGKVGDLASMRRNVLLLKDYVAVPDDVLAALGTGTVIAFSGHMLDHPDRAGRGLPPRFPADPDLEGVVRGALRQALDRVEPVAGYCSAACGADILFAEAMLDRGAELHVILPFDLEDFHGTSVDFGLAGMACWRQRCAAVLESATEVHYATREHYLGDDVLFELNNALIRGLALTRAAELLADVHGLFVLDEGSPGSLGGSASIRTAWESLGKPATIVDLARLRGSRVADAPTGPAAPSAAPSGAPAGREVKAMLFGDVKNFSKLTEEQAPFFFHHFLTRVAELAQGAAQQPVFSNTWGDGLFLVFDDVAACAAFALDLLDCVRDTDWQRWNLPADTTVRIGLHAGPVFPELDPVIRRRNFFGSHVNRAARIEPVTTPGCAFATEQFAGLLAASGTVEVHCEYVGVEDLAKGYDRCALYRLARGGAAA